MILGIGNDLIAVDRINDSWQRHGQRFLDRILSSDEQAYCLAHREPAERIAGRWAAKEACLKALGSGLIKDMKMSEIGVSNNQLGAPQIALSGAVASYSQQFPAHTFWCSISHADGFALATVIMEMRPE